jgi:Skp family chaperone for outer membrane proteins
MANKTVDVAALRDKSESELTQMQTDLAALQAEMRGSTDPNARAPMVARIQEKKRELAAKADEFGELARAAALVAGGTNYRPPR